MNLAIMQPYFLPYIGYFQLIAAADMFVVYDRIKYTKKGWINRNRMLMNGSDAPFSLPLKRDSDSLDVVAREIAPDFNPDRVCQQIRGAYQRAPFFGSVFPVIEQILQYRNRNLFHFIHHSLVVVCKHLDITSEIRVSSTIPIDDGLRGHHKVLALCKAVGASRYINSIGGTELYARQDFRQQGIELQFLQPQLYVYPQFGQEFVPWLSILDVMMFNPREVVHSHVQSGFDLIHGIS